MNVRVLSPWFPKARGGSIWTRRVPPDGVSIRYSWREWCRLHAHVASGATLAAAQAGERRVVRAPVVFTGYRFGWPSAKEDGVTVLVRCNNDRQTPMTRGTTGATAQRKSIQWPCGVQPSMNGSSIRQIGPLVMS